MKIKWLIFIEYVSLINSLLILSGCSEKPYDATEPVFEKVIHDDSPAWAPNGQFIAYTHITTSLDEDPQYSYAQIWLHDLESDTSYIFIYPAIKCRWSHDNSFIAFTGAWPSNVYFYYIESDTIIRITNDSYHGLFDMAPDGRSIVTNASPNVEYGLWTIDITGVYNRNITPGPPAGDTPRWSRYSGRILYNRAGDGHYYQFGVSDSFGNYLGLVHPTSWNQYQACWGPEDTIVALTNGMTSDLPHRRTMIYFANRRSGSLDFFTLGWSPDWSYDGRYLAFADRSEDPPRFTIWVIGADGTEKREISRSSYAADTVAFSGNDYPRCVLPEAIKNKLRAR